MNSSFSHLELSGAVPDSAELRSILSVTEKLEAEVKDLDNKLSGLSARAEVARKELCSARERLQYHQGLSSSLRRIPPEVLCKIFLQTVPLLPAGILGMTLAPPWSLLTVCRRWHDVCLDYGVLWGRIHLDCTFIKAEHPNFSNNGPSADSWTSSAAPNVPGHAILGAVRLLELQLSRSQNADLHVTIQARPGFDYAHPFLRILLPHLRRCVKLTAPRHVIAHTPLGHCERLRHLEVDYTSVMKHADHPSAHVETPELLAQENEYMEIITSLSKLATYTASIPSGFSHDMHNRSVRLQLPERLTSIVLCGSGAGLTLNPILSRLQNLVHLHVEDPTVSYHTDAHIVTEDDDPVEVALTHGIRVELHSLKSVSLRGPHIVSLILGNIIAPNLLELTNSGAVDKKDVLLNFLIASGCSLRKLVLRTRSRSAVIVGLLQSKPELWATLKTLRIHFVKEYRYTRIISSASELHNEDGLAIMEVLTRRATVLDIFPSLTTIELAGAASPIRGVIDMIESRRVLTSLAVISSSSPRLLQAIDLTDLNSIHRQYTNEEADEIVSRDRKHRLVESGRQHGGFMYYQDPFSEAHRHEMSAEEKRMLVNPVLPWAQGLQREADQEKRLSELQRGGLEVWLNSNPIRKNFPTY